MSRLVVLVVALGLAGCGGERSTRARDVTLGVSGPVSPAAGERRVGGQPAARQASQARPAPRPSSGRSVSRSPRRPRILKRPIPFGAERIEQTAAYSERHYGERKTRLEPKVIVEHFTVIPSADRVRSLFAENKRDAELHELPGVCSHFLIDRDGTIYQLVPVRLICRHTVGLNDVAIGIEHVGASDDEILGNRAQLAASLELTAWLRCRHRIEPADVIGHAESLSSPHHHEQVRALRRQTHDDFKPAAMRRYRARLGRLGC